MDDGVLFRLLSDIVSVLGIEFLYYISYQFPGKTLTMTFKGGFYHFHGAICHFLETAITPSYYPP